MAPKSSFEPAREIFSLLIALSSDECSGELAQMCRLDRAIAARIRATVSDRHFSQYVRFWYCDEGSGEPVQMFRFSRTLGDWGAIYEKCNFPRSEGSDEAACIFAQAHLSLRHSAMQ